MIRLSDMTHVERTSDYMTSLTGLEAYIIYMYV